MIPDTEAVLKLNPREALKQPRSAIKVLIVIGFALLFFLLEEKLHISPSFVALGAAALGLLWLRPNMTETLKLIEWNVLIFFGALFVIVGGMEAAGVLQSLSELIAGAASQSLLVMGVGLLWVSAILSAVVDNVPITIALIPVIENLGKTRHRYCPPVVGPGLWSWFWRQRHCHRLDSQHRCLFFIGAHPPSHYPDDLVETRHTSHAGNLFHSQHSLYYLLLRLRILMRLY